MQRPSAGGGWQAIRYTFRKAFEVGPWSMWKAMRSRNACKTCAVGMGGQSGGMVNERGHFPEVCKKSLQAMAADMQGAIRDDFFETYSLQQLERFSPRELETSGRLTRPLICEESETHYRPVEWDVALGRIVQKLRDTAPDESFFYFSGRSSMEAGFLLQLFARVYGTNNVNNCSYYCHQASGVGLSSSVGSGTATIRLEDLEQSDLVFVIGGNPPSNHPRLMTTLMHVRRSGGEVVVVNPAVETGLVRFRVPSDWRSMLRPSEIASQYVQPHIGGDLALLSGIAKGILEIGAHDASFLNNHCQGWPEWKAALEALSWDEIQSASGVPRAEIDQLVQRYARAERVVFCWTMGITHHAHGVQNVQAIANLALMRGMVGRPGAGLLPIRGHSNVQGIGSVGVTPQLKQAFFERLESTWGIKLPTTPGRDTLACMQGAAEGALKVGICLGGNLYGSNPDAVFAARALQSLDQVVYLSTTLNTGHAHGQGRETIILPVQARDEESQPTTQESMFNFVRLSDGGPSRHTGPRSEVDVISQLAHGLLGSDGAVPWESLSDHNRIRETIASVVPGFEAIRDIEQTRKEFTIDGRTLHEPRFNMPEGKAVLHVHKLPPLAGKDDQLRLMTVRSEGQFNTVVYEEEDIYRGQDRRDVILLHPDDLQARGLKDRQWVRVQSETGQMDRIQVRSYEQIRSGNALMYYPEANVLISRRVDPASQTPAFKGALVTVQPVEA